MFCPGKEVTFYRILIQFELYKILIVAKSKLNVDKQGDDALRNITEFTVYYLQSAAALQENRPYVLIKQLEQKRK